MILKPASWHSCSFPLLSRCSKGKKWGHLRTAIVIEVCEYRELARERVKRKKRGIDGDALFFLSSFSLWTLFLRATHTEKKKKKKVCGLACCSVCSVSEAQLDKVTISLSWWRQLGSGVSDRETKLACPFFQVVAQCGTKVLYRPAASSHGTSSSNSKDFLCYFLFN